MPVEVYQMEACFERRSRGSGLAATMTMDVSSRQRGGAQANTRWSSPRPRRELDRR